MLLRLPKLERGRVDAVAETGGFGAILEDMPEVCIATGAMDFRATHEEGVVLGAAHMIGKGCVKAWPTRARLKLGVRVKEIKVAGDAVVDAFLMVVVILAAEGGFCTMLAGDTVLLRSELLLPLSIRLRDFLKSHIR